MKIEVDTLIIGAGVIGSSVAMHLARMGMKGIRVVDFDLEGALSSSELNAGGVRATWNHPINIAMSKATIEFFATRPEEVGYRPCGYLWLHPAERMEGALKSRDKMLEVGWPVEAWDIAKLRSQVPFIDKTDGIAGAIFSPRDGLVNPNLLKNHYRALARDNGVVFDGRTLVRGAEPQQGVYRWKISAEKFEGQISTETKIRIYAADPRENGSSGIEYHAKNVVNCAGPWAARIASILGYRSPCAPVRRQVSIFDCRDVDLTRYGMIVDTSGVYFHPEATNGLAGFATPGEPNGINFEYDGENFFMEKIWPALYERSTGFERLKHVTGWAGHYEVSPDESAIIGAVADGDAGKSGTVFEAHSFSGHGVMHSFAAGRALAELITQGRYETLDLSPLSARRFADGKEVRENLVI